MLPWIKSVHVPGLHVCLTIEAAAMHRVSGVLAGIEARVADWLMVPSFNGEGIQVTHVLFAQ
jgi:hypothetical protein